MRTRLRDGTVTTVGELKKLADEARELRAKVPQIAAQERQLSDRTAQLAQQEQFVQQVLPQAIAILQAYIPPPPDPALLQTDVIAHYEQNTRHQQALAQLRQMQDAYATQQATQQKQADEAAEAARQQRLDAGRKLLLEKIPDVADPEKAKVIYQDFYDTATKFGFDKADVDGVDDPRILHLVHTLSKKAAAYDKLMAQKPAVQAKVQKAAPVQRPGPRPSPEANQLRAWDDRFKQMRDSGGDINQAIAAFATLEQDTA
jgi:hypothetical protein